MLKQYGHFTYLSASGFKWTAQDAIQVKTFLDDACKAQRLTPGKWKKRVALTCSVMSRMNACWLNHHVAHGTANWDVILHKLLEIALVTSLGCRSGNVARTPGYTNDEHFDFKDVELMVEDSSNDGNNNDVEPTWDQVRAKVTLRFLKRLQQNHELRAVHLRPITDVKNIHLCPLTLLLIHSFRHGLVQGSTI